MGNDIHLDGINFAQFLEAMGRCALLFFPNENELMEQVNLNEFRSGS